MIGQRHLAGNPCFPPVQVVLAGFHVRVSDPTYGGPKPPQVCRPKAPQVCQCE